MTSRTFGIAFFALSTVFVIAGLMAEAQGEGPSNVAFKISGGGTAPTGLVPPPDPAAPSTCHNATGTATHLGEYSTRDGKFEITSFDFDTLTGEFFGSVVFIAANGDELKFDYHASATPEIDGTGKFVGEFVDGPGSDIVATFVQEFTPDPEGSTGRFKKVIGGSFIMTATSEPVPAPYFGVPFAYTWEGEGTLEFAAGDE